MKKLLILLSAVAVFAIPQHSLAALTTNIISYWKLDGNSNDAAGSNNGSDTSITYSLANGKINQGAGFNGTSSYISHSASGFPTTGARTISAWVKFAVLPSNGTSMFIASYGAQSTNDEFGLAVVNISGTYYLRNGLYGGDYDAAYAFTTCTWYFLVTEWDGTTRRGYVNGAQVGSGAAQTISSTASTGYIGRHGSGNYMNGDIDEVGVWSRNLSTAELTQLYNSGAGLQYPFGPTFSIWQFFAF